MAGRRRLARAVALAFGLAGAALAVLVPSLAAAEARVAFTISDSRIAQPTGLARDQPAGLYWTVDGAGRGGVAYAVGPSGRVAGTLNFRATLTDVEAVAVHGDRLYVADIGDGAKRRRMVSVYYFDSPRPNGLTVTYRSYDFTYPDGPHDAGTLLVDDAGRLAIVTKDAGGAVYTAPAQPRSSGTNALTRVGAAPGEVTDGVVLPGGQQIALLTRASVDVLDARTYQTLSSTPIALQDQAESMALGLDGQSLLVGGGGRPSRVYAVPLPAAPQAAVPSASPSATTSTNPDAGPGIDLTPSVQDRSGLLLALAVAAFVALVAGMVVAAVRTPEPASRPLRGGERPDDKVDATGEGGDVVRVDVGKHPDP